MAGWLGSVTPWQASSIGHLEEEIQEITQFEAFWVADVCPSGLMRRRTLGRWSCTAGSVYETPSLRTLFRTLYGVLEPFDVNDGTDKASLRHITK